MLRHLARSLISVGDLEGAADVRRTIVTLRPDDAGAHYDLAGTLGFIRRYAEAAAPIEIAIRLAPGDIAAVRRPPSSTSTRGAPSMPSPSPSSSAPPSAVTSRQWR
ncbi:MAG: hypothetical protein QF450_00145 [Rhodospirillales bacterium]|nr:hypothetical protein [Rhodospirillales bacterium]